MKNEKFIKYGSIEEFQSLRNLENFFEGNKTYVFEKIDGGNCQIRNLEGRLVAGSKANFLRGPIVKKTRWFSKLVNWMHSNPEFYSLPQNLIIFGEFSSRHTIRYAPHNTDRFYFLDLFDQDTNRFIEYPAAREFISQFNIHSMNYADPIYHGPLDVKIMKEILESPSKLYPGKKEGIVIKDYKSQKFCKVLNEGFSEKRKKTFGRLDPFTDARIRKAMFRIYDEIGEVSFQRLVDELRADVFNEIGREYDLKYISKKAAEYIHKSHKESNVLKRLRKYPENPGL